MRIGAVLLVLFGIGWLAGTLPATSGPSEPASNVSWRRTRDGWQHGEPLLFRASKIANGSAGDHLTVHPAVVAGAELLFAVSALVGLSPTDDSK